MSKYTTEVRFICENYSGYTEKSDLDDVEKVIAASRSKIFNFPYNIYDDSYKPVLETKILRRYYFREISEETVGLWKQRLCARMNEIMPFYSKLYESAAMTFNPFYDTDYTVDHRGSDAGQKEDAGEHSRTETYSDTVTKRGTRGLTNTRTDNLQESQSGTTSETVSSVTSDTATGSTESENWDLISDTPQGSIQNLDNNTYLSQATKRTGESDTDTSSTSELHSSTGGTSSGTRTNTGTQQNVVSEQTQDNDTTQGSRSDNGTNGLSSTYSNTDTYIDHIIGKRGSQSYMMLIKEWRENILNIDQMIINELADLFFGLW